MSDALIGHTGFVGTNLLEVGSFDARFNSSNIGKIRGRHFRRIVCAGISAVKWWANQNPDEDRRRIDMLAQELEHVSADVFALVSTIDVYSNPNGVTEDDPQSSSNEPYGRNRLAFEDFVSKRFPNHHIVRLPSLFGPHLKKNAIYDLIHDNRLEFINPSSSFQWYPIKNLARDLAIIEAASLRLVNLATEPLTMDEIRRKFFPKKTLGGKAGQVASYDMRSCYCNLWGRNDGYQMGADDVLLAMQNFFQDEVGL